MKTKILNVLEEKRGEFVSGEYLAELFSVSRAAIWKSINLLRKEGHKIQSVQKKGYSLMNISDVLTEKGITAKLEHDTKISRVICLDEIDSTNNYAKKLALSGAEHGTLIAANHQTAGRGRHGHNFVSPPGTGLYMSIILRPKIEAEKFQMITIADAVAVCLAIEDLYPESKGNIKIKWVNDIFLRDKKITGILTEAVSNFENGEIESVVTGIGINVSTEKFSDDIAETAGSIFPDGKILFSRNELCARAADYIMNFAENLNAPELINAYRERSMLIGETITYMKENIMHSAQVQGIDDSGGLVILNDGQKKETLRSGEVFMIRKQERKDFTS